MKIRFNLPEIEKSLHDFRIHFESINERLSLHREPFTEPMVGNLIEAYTFLNNLLAREVDLFSLTGLHSLLELNHTVLCGTDPSTRLEFHKHLVQTRKRFHEGISPCRKWVENTDPGKKPFKQAAGFYAKALSQPQLFIEGNHRTENIIINYLLISAGKPPFVISSANAFDYLELSGKIKFTDKKGLKGGKWELPAYRKQFMAFLKEQVTDRYLINV